MPNNIQPSHAQEEQPEFIGRCIHCNVQLFGIDGKVYERESPPFGYLGEWAREAGREWPCR